MDYDLEMPVTYKNQELIFPAKFIQFGYSYKFEIDLNGITVFFERDEERNFRAIIDHFTMRLSILIFVYISSLI